MTKAEVRKAIESDLDVASKSIRAGENKVERTSVLTVGVPNLIPSGGRAVISYVFGYKSKRLIQVGVTWSKATDPSLTPKTLVSNGKLLQEYFIKEHFSPGTVQTDRPVRNGLLLFRGTDAKGRAAVLLMLGSMKKGGDAKRKLTPTLLALLYVADPKHPDIFRLAKGQF